MGTGDGLRGSVRILQILWVCSCQNIDIMGRALNFGRSWVRWSRPFVPAVVYPLQKGFQSSLSRSWLQLESYQGSVSAYIFKGDQSFMLWGILLGRVTSLDHILLLLSPEKLIVRGPFSTCLPQYHFHGHDVLTLHLCVPNIKVYTLFLVV